MDDFKEFQGRDLDKCIEQAMRWFDSPREALEIEILQDAKSGIFGIVGARKARIRARRAHVAEAVRDILAKGGGGKDVSASRRMEEAGPGVRRAKTLPEPEAGPERSKERAAAPCPKGESEMAARASAPAPRAVKTAAPRTQGEAVADFDDDDQDEPPIAPVDLDPVEFEREAREIISKLAEPIAGRDLIMHVDLAGGRPRVKIDWEGDAGLIIGRDGQTLAALQYMASRLLSRALGVPVRIQLDIGEYRSRQDEKLRELAHSLAEKVRQTGKPASTRPLSSYHRRVVHLSLQGEADIVTRSAGEGVMKRVVILPGRS